MQHWAKRIIAAAAPLFLAGCLWGPGKFASDLTLKKDGSFILDYRGEIVLQTPPDMAARPEPWKPDFARCYKDGRTEILTTIGATVQVTEEPPPGNDKVRACTAAEIAKLKSRYEREAAERAAAKRKENEEMAKVFGLPGSDDASSRRFAANLMKYQGWRSVTYKGKGV